MLLPPQYFWLEPVLFAAIIVFIVDLVGNMITFSNRLANALVTAVLFTGLFGALVYYGYGNIQVTVNKEPTATAPAKKL